jgi:outer membrane protein assembly factor BamE (lipoprotein component of BamABCDE complex)
MGLVAGCSPVYRNHGFVPTEFQLREVAVGADTRETVQQKIGTPGTTGVLGEDAWYFVGSRWEHFAFRAPRPVEREIVAVSFAPDGRVRNIERFGLEDGRVIALSRRVTDDNIEGVSFLRQLFGNVGRINLDRFTQ